MVELTDLSPEDQALAKRFNEETGKNAVYRGRITKNFTTWKSKQEKELAEQKQKEAEKEQIKQEVLMEQANIVPPKDKEDDFSDEMLDIAKSEEEVREMIGERLGLFKEIYGRKLGDGEVNKLIKTGEIVRKAYEHDNSKTGEYFNQCAEGIFSDDETIFLREKVFISVDQAGILRRCFEEATSECFNDKDSLKDFLEEKGMPDNLQQSIIDNFDELKKYQSAKSEEVFESKPEEKSNKLDNFVLETVYQIFKDKLKDNQLTDDQLLQIIDIVIDSYHSGESLNGLAQTLGLPEKELMRAFNIYSNNTAPEELKTDLDRRINQFRFLRKKAEETKHEPTNFLGKISGLVCHLSASYQKVKEDEEEEKERLKNLKRKEEITKELDDELISKDEMERIGNIGNGLGNVIAGYQTSESFKVIDNEPDLSTDPLANALLDDEELKFANKINKIVHYLVKDHVKGEIKSINDKLNNNEELTKEDVEGLRFFNSIDNFLLNKGYFIERKEDSDNNDITIEKLEYNPAEAKEKLNKIFVEWLIEPGDRKIARGADNFSEEQINEKIVGLKSASGGDYSEEISGVFREVNITSSARIADAYLDLLLECRKDPKTLEDNSTKLCKIIKEETEFDLSPTYLIGEIKKLPYAFIKVLDKTIEAQPETVIAQPIPTITQPEVTAQPETVIDQKSIVDKVLEGLVMTAKAPKQLSYDDALLMIKAMKDQFKDAFKKKELADAFPTPAELLELVYEVYLGEEGLTTQLTNELESLTNEGEVKLTLGQKAQLKVLSDKYDNPIKELTKNLKKYFRS